MSKQNVQEKYLLMFTHFYSKMIRVKSSATHCCYGQSTETAIHVRMSIYCIGKVELVCCACRNDEIAERDGGTIGEAHLRGKYSCHYCRQ